MRCITSSSVFQSGPDGPLSCMSPNKPDSVELVVIRRQQSSMMSWSYESCIRENRLVFRCVFDPLPVLKVDIYRNFSAVFSLDAAIFGKLRNVRHYAFMSQQWACAERAQSENNQVITFTWDDIYFDRSMKWLNLPPTPATDWNLVLACLFWLRCLYGAFLFCWAFKPFIIAAQCQMPTCLTSELPGHLPAKVSRCCSNDRLYF